MGSICYFMPGVKTINRIVIKKAGMGYILPAEGEPEYTETMPRNAKKEGVAFAFPDAKGKTHLGHTISVAKWHEVTGFDNILMCIDPENRPGPKDLTGKNIYTGHPVMLADGNEWLIPAARHLPREVRYDETGWNEGAVTPEHKIFFDKSLRVWDDFIKLSEKKPTEELSVDVKEGYEIAAMALSIHYRVRAPEISLLGLFTSGTSGNQADVLRAIVDLPFIEEYIKKNGIPDIPSPEKQCSAHGETD